jgi:hypothetical protein
MRPDFPAIEKFLSNGIGVSILKAFSCFFDPK